MSITTSSIIWSHHTQPVCTLFFVKSMEGYTTKGVALVQRDLLQQILERNAGTEYLRKHGLGKHSDLVDGFKKLPLVDYSDIEEDIKRIAEGDTAQILCSDPVCKFFVSSGTTNGRSKLIPMTKEAVDEAHKHVFRIAKDEFYLAFWFASKQFITEGGFKAETVTTSGLNSDDFKKVAAAFATPYEVYQDTNVYQCMYCHLLCGLLRRKQVTIVISAFAFTMTLVFRMLEDVWPELLEDIEAGTLSSRITNSTLRLAMARIARRPDPQLAAELSREFSDMTGIVQRLWPNAKCIVAVTTGAMAPYVPWLRAIAGKTPIVSGNYFSSECLIAINRSPSATPEKAAFTVNPEFAYFEFLPVDDDDGDDEDEESNLESRAVGLTEVKIGRQYEIIVTTRAGLYRYRLGDVVQVTGFFNSCPTLAFLFRKKVVLSVATDKTDESELQAVVLKAAKLLESSNKLLDFACYADFSSMPGHYAIFWELTHNDSVRSQDLQECCDLLDASLNNPYMRGRSSGAIGPLELCLVASGTFRKIFEQHIARGGSGSQYKGCRCLANDESIQLVRRNAIQQVFGQGVLKSDLAMSI